MSEKELRALIARCSDEVVSTHYTEEKVAKRATNWQAGNKEAPDAAETLTMTLAEARQFSEELLFHVLKELQK